jgi:putative ABC transport system permease protein
VPLALLQQQQRTLRMFNALMTAIAAISLLVGGIGIMNIMLASVTERTREIGIRRAVGATRRHIIAQFLTETTTLSSIGGALGVGVGLGAVFLLAWFKRAWPAAFTQMGVPIPTDWSIIAGLTVAVLVGTVFGLYPAIKAAHQDPIESLRHE